MKKIILVIVALVSLSSFAKTELVVKSKVSDVLNVGNGSKPGAMVVLNVTANATSATKYVSQSWVVTLKADGTLEEVQGPNGDLKAEYQILNQLRYVDAKSSVEATMYGIKVKYDSRKDYVERSLVILVKDNGQVEIFE